jgi:tyrosine-protein phosphatase YwqE
MTFFKKIFSGKEKEPGYPPVSDYSAIITDIHSHLIPEIDDGVKTPEESADMLRAFVKLGYKKVITTPHVMGDYYKNTPEIILAGLEKLRQLVAHENIPIAVEAAAEYYIDELFAEKLASKKILVIQEKFLLFEISYMNPPENLSRLIFDMGTSGYTPLMAHPERYPFWYSKFEEYHKLKEQGVLFQVNIGSLAGYYGLLPKKIAERMIDENLVDFIGSDLHGDRHLIAMQQALKSKHLWKLFSKGVLNTGL